MTAEAQWRATTWSSILETPGQTVTFAFLLDADLLALRQSCVILRDAVSQTQFGQRVPRQIWAAHTPPDDIAAERLRRYLSCYPRAECISFPWGAARQVLPLCGARVTAVKISGLDINDDAAVVSLRCTFPHLSLLSLIHCTATGCTGGTLIVPLPGSEGSETGEEEEVGAKDGGTGPVGSGPVGLSMLHSVETLHLRHLIADPDAASFRLPPGLTDLQVLDCYVRADSVDEGGGPAGDAHRVHRHLNTSILQGLNELQRLSWEDSDEDALHPRDPGPDLATVCPKLVTLRVRCDGPIPLHIEWHRLNTLKRLDADVESVPPGWITELPPSLMSLSLQGPTDGGTLSVTDAHLCPLTQLVELMLHNMHGVTGEAVENMTGLERLVVHRCNAFALTPARLSPYLHTLQLTPSAYPPRGVLGPDGQAPPGAVTDEHLYQMAQNIKALELIATHASDASLSACTQLRELHVWGDLRISGAFLAHMPHLYALTLSHCKAINTTELESMACTGLRALTLMNTTLHGTGPILSRLAQLNELTWDTHCLLPQDVSACTQVSSLILRESGKVKWAWLNDKERDAMRGLPAALVSLARAGRLQSVSVPRTLLPPSGGSGPCAAVETTKECLHMCGFVLVEEAEDGAFKMQRAHSRDAAAAAPPVSAGDEAARLASWRASRTGRAHRMITAVLRRGRDVVVALLQRRAGKAVAAVVMLALLDKITGALTTLPFYGWAATVVGWAWALVRGACDVLLGASVPLLAIGVIQSGIAMSLLGACGVPRPARPLRLWAIILLSLLLGVLGIAVFAGLFVLVYVQGTRTGIISNNIAFMTGCALAATLMKDRD